MKLCSQIKSGIAVMVLSVISTAILANDSKISLDNVEKTGKVETTKGDVVIFMNHPDSHGNAHLISRLPVCDHSTIPGAAPQRNGGGLRIGNPKRPGRDSMPGALTNGGQSGT